MSSKKLRIAFTGASGTGKTTTALLLSSDIGLPINPVGSRSVAASMNLSSPYDADAFGLRAEFQKKLFLDKTNWEKENESFITDRTHLDNLVYSIMHDCVKTVGVEYIEQTVLLTKQYTHIVFFPLDVFIKTDSDTARLNNIEYQKTYEYLLKMFYHSQGKQEFNMLILKSLSAEDRLKEIRHFING